MALLSRRGADEYWAAVSSSSGTIKVARVFCIFFMSYVHLHFFGLDLFGSEAYMVVRTILVDVLGRSSVPLLSIISGFLAWGVFQRRSSISVFKARARTILLPMILWNALGTFILFIRSGPIYGLDFLNSIFPLAGGGAYASLDFLRDIYVMTLITPLLVLVAKKCPQALILVTITVTVLDLSLYIIIRNQIFLFYVIGVLCACYKFNFSFSGLFCVVASGLIVIGVSLIEVADLYGYSTHDYYDDLIRRPLMVVFSWLLCGWLARGSALGFFVFLERHVFSFFLSHIFLLTLIGTAFYRMHFLHGNVAYAAVWLASPAIAYALVVMVRVLWEGLFRKVNAPELNA